MLAYSINTFRLRTILFFRSAKEQIRRLLSQWELHKTFLFSGHKQIVLCLIGPDVLRGNNFLGEFLFTMIIVCVPVCLPNCPLRWVSNCGLQICALITWYSQPQIDPWMNSFSYLDIRIYRKARLLLPFTPTVKPSELWAWSDFSIVPEVLCCSDRTPVYLRTATIGRRSIVILYLYLPVSLPTHSMLKSYLFLSTMVPFDIV